MSSASEPSGAGGLWWRGFLVAAAAGACVGIADVARALLATHELVQSRDAPHVILFYAAVFAPLGIVAGLAARLFDRPRRALHLLALVGATFFFAGAWANISLLPGFTEKLSLFADAALAAVCLFWFHRRYRYAGEDKVPVVRWLVAGVVAAGIAFGVAFFVPSRDDGPAPQAAAAPDAKRPNVLLYLCDTLRADHLGCYGYDKPTSAEIDAFAKDATLFRDCRTVTPWTKPSVASLFTSLYPSLHSCIEQREVLAPEAETIAEVFRAAGWRTAAFVDNPFVSPEFGFGQGFETYEYVRPSVVANGTLLGKALFMTRILSLVGEPFGVGKLVERGARVIDGEFLTRFGAERKPWFAYVHAMEPHLPYKPEPEDAAAMGIAGTTFADPPAWNGILPFQATPAPPPEFTAQLVAQYDAEIRGFSRGFGALLDEMRRRGLLENTIVVFVSDHGEEFHEHGGWTHGQSLHRELTQVPFVLRLPDSFGEAAKAARGRAVGGVATLLDVFPTLVDLCGIRWPRGDERRCGASLAPQILAPADRGPPSVPERVLLSEMTTSPVGLRGIREGRWQLIVAHQPMEDAILLYDDASDPAHRRNRADDDTVETALLRLRLDSAFKLFERASLSHGERDLDPETAERLQQIGYVGGK